ncbi:MAG: peptidoglycan editing factor PgeF [Parabacteroides sp.]
MTRMRQIKHKTCEMLQFPALSGCCDIFHFVTTRHGGVSEGTFSSFNPSRYTDDNPNHIRQNLSLLAEAIGLPPERIILPHQVHRDKVLTLTDDFFGATPDEQLTRLEGVDALVANVPGWCVAVSTADCVPVLLYAPDKQVVAAVHAGWRGTVQRIVQRCVEKMQERFACDPAEMRAAIGPSIGQAAFEVGEEVVKAFEMAGLDVSRLLRRHPDTGKAHIDLWEANRQQLCEAGLDQTSVEVAGLCTFTHPDDFFSARRLGIRSGRILSGIYLRPTIL